jgi:hypothetical protein
MTRQRYTSFKNISSFANTLINLVTVSVSETDGKGLVVHAQSCLSNQLAPSTPHKKTTT